MASLANRHGVGRPGTKSAQAFRTITEVASELEVPQHVLRFWENKFPQIRPLKLRGGRRYYRPEDVILLKRIRTLLYSDGYTIKGVQKVLHEDAGKMAAVAAASGPETTVPAAGAEPKPGLGQSLRAELEAILHDLESACRRLRQGPD
jgi:DNA-binding transcriptional MerR regulator